jgi:hypothetical protein
MGGAKGLAARSGANLARRSVLMTRHMAYVLCPNIGPTPAIWNIVHWRRRSRGRQSSAFFARRVATVTKFAVSEIVL